MILRAIHDFSILVVLTAAVFSTPAASAEAISVINIKAKVSGYEPLTGFTNPVSVTLPSGTYTISDAAGVPAAKFQAFNEHYHSYNDWYWNYSVGNALNGALLMSVGPTRAFPSKSAATRAGLRVKLHKLTLAAPTTLWFAINDNFLPDNTGGVSLRIEPQ